MYSAKTHKHTADNKHLNDCLKGSDGMEWDEMQIKLLALFHVEDMLLRKHNCVLTLNWTDFPSFFYSSSLVHRYIE